KQGLLEAAKDCDFIVHTAAQPAMTIAIENPELDIRTNVVGTFNVLEASRKYDVPIVICSSIHVYGNKLNETITEGKTRFLREPPTIDETYPVMQGRTTPLHASKRCAEIYAQTYIDTYELDAAVYRLTGMYGPRQFGGEDHGWVANFLIRTILGLPIKIFGTDKQVRDILYASDAVEAFDAFNRNRKPGLYNIGGGVKNTISIGECLEMLRKITGLEQKLNYEPARAGDLWYFVSDITKAKEQLGWEPKVPNNVGLAKLAAWVKENSRLFGG
ncbi:NAD-dependent epimerase/dehydratase family protein, partial [Candidatus Bathyarchaeota archaeon]|nr:NAD-dependent epimerase/dehydratase family protein [Candidatus Bathyarchaeota archaeon]